MTRVFIEAGAVKTQCVKMDRKGFESVCGYAEMSGSLVRRYVDLVLPNENATSAWTQQGSDPFYAKTYSLSGNRLEVLLWDVDDGYTTLYFYYDR